MRRPNLSLAFLFAAVSTILSTAASALIAVGDLGIPGQPKSVAVVEGIAYVANDVALNPWNTGLKVIDVSDPTAPVELGAFNTPGRATIVIVVDGLAYVFDRATVGIPGSGVLRMIDASDPAVPVEVGAVDMLNAVLDFAVADGFAYVADLTISPRGEILDFALRIFDVSNPAAPIELDPIETPTAAQSVAVVDGIAYVASGSSGLVIFDVSNPSAPFEISALAIPGRAIGVTVVDGLAYVTTDSAELRVIDISTPAAPVEIGSVDAAVNGRHVAVESGFPYLAYHSGGLRLIDISNPAAPIGLDGMLDPTSGARDVAIAGGLAYVVGDSGLAAVDLSNPAFPAEIGATESEGMALTVEDGLAYTVGDGLRVIDISNPTSPGELGSIQANLWVDVAVAGGRAYVADTFSSGALRIIDVSNPAAPFGLGFVSLSGGLSDSVAVADELAYLINSRGLLIADVSNPAVPVEIYRGTDRGFAIEVVGDVAYTVDGSRLRLIDISNPAAPVGLSVINTPGSASAVTVAGGLAYVGVDGGSSSGSLRVIDVSIPTAPVELGAVNLFGGVINVAVTGGLAYVTTFGAGLRLIDVSNPAAPVELGGVVGGRDVAVIGGLAHVVGGRNLRIIDFGPEYNESVEIDIDIKPGSDPNAINPSLEGDLPVAILGLAAFNVADVDVTTLVFGRSGTSFDHSHGPHFEDLNGDGFTDLMAHFRTEETGIAFGDRMVCLSGEMIDGTPINGCDDVRTVPDMDGDKLLDVQEATIGTHSLNPDTDGDGFDDGQEVLVMGTDPLDPLDPEPDPVPEPASWLLLCAGTAFLGLLYRRRDQVSRRASRC